MLQSKLLEGGLYAMLFGFRVFAIVKTPWRGTI